MQESEQARELQEAKFSDERGEDMFIYGDLKHFGISQKDFQSAKVFRCKNNKFFREKTGVDQAIGACERMDGERVRKARIIIDYDADFPRIVTRVISL